MTNSPIRRIRIFFLLAFGAMLAACQSVPPPGGFNAAQVAALKAEGFVETDSGWQLTLNERLLFASDESALRPEQIASLGDMARHLAAVGIC